MSSSAFLEIGERSHGGFRRISEEILVHSAGFLTDTEKKEQNTEQVTCSRHMGLLNDCQTILVGPI